MPIDESTPPTTDWPQAFRRDGYVHFRELVPAALVETARNAIDRDVEKHFDAARLVEYNNQSWCPGLRRSSEIKQLFENPAVQAIADKALGKKRYGFDAGQIAVRQAHNANGNYPPTPHIDGIPTPHNGLQGTGLQSFTALVGVFLTEVKSDYAGNFTVWPESHLATEKYFREHGTAALNGGMPNIRLGAPVQLQGKPGDVVFCHYELAHAAAGNSSDHDRIAVFFRLWFKDIAGPDRVEQRWRNLTNIWDGWQI